MRDEVPWHSRRFLLYLLCLPLLNGCEGKPGQSRGTRPSGALWIAVVTPSEYAADWPGVAGGAARYLATTPGVSGECVAPRADESAVAFARRILDRQPAAVVLLVPAVSLVEPLARALRAAHVPVVAVGEPLPEELAAGHVEVPRSEAAELLARALPRVIGDGRSFVLVRLSSSTEGAEHVNNRFMSVVRQRAAPRLLADAEVDETAGPAAAVAALLGQYPRTSLVVTLDAAVWLDPPLGWEAELREISPNYRFATLSAAPRLWAALGTPEHPGRAAALVGALDGDRGYAAVELAVRLALNPETPRRRSVPAELVTAETLPDFARRYSDAAGGLDVAAWLPPSDKAPAADEAGDAAGRPGGRRAEPGAAAGKSFGPPAEADGP